MKKIMAVVALALTLPASSAQGMLAYCSEPNAPTAFLRKPTKPYCAASRSCSDFEVSSYRSDVEMYFQRLSRYAREVDDYYTEAARYVKCMSSLD